MKLRIFAATLALLGQFIILSLFLWVFPEGTAFGSESIKWLDFGVLSIAYWLWMGGMCFYSINEKGESQKWVAAMGIRISSVFWYTTIALLFAIICLWINATGEGYISFPWQIGTQAVILFLFLVGILLSGKSASQAEKVYYEEKEKKAGKIGVKGAVSELLFTAEDKDFPPYLTQRIREISDETRFLTPSSDAAAKALERKIETECREAATMGYDFNMNKDRIEDLVASIARNLQRRKQY